MIRAWLHASLVFVGGCVEEIGLDPAEFGRLSRDPAVRAQLVASKNEGLELGVDATPTLFVDGCKYDGDLAIEEIVDVLEEAYETHAR